jgi:hypothetical protein
VVLEISGHTHGCHVSWSAAFGQNVDHLLLYRLNSLILHILHHHDLPQDEIIIISFLLHHIFGKKANRHILKFVDNSWLLPLRLPLIVSVEILILIIHVHLLIVVVI